MRKIMNNLLNNIVNNLKCKTFGKILLYLYQWLFKF